MQQLQCLPRLASAVIAPHASSVDRDPLLCVQAPRAGSQRRGHTVVRLQHTDSLGAVTTGIADVLCLFSPVADVDIDDAHDDDLDALAFVREYVSVTKDGTSWHPVAKGLDFVVRSQYYALVSVRAILGPACVVPNFGGVVGGEHNLRASDLSNEALQADARTYFVVPTR